MIRHPCGLNGRRSRLWHGERGRERTFGQRPRSRGGSVNSRLLDPDLAQCSRLDGSGLKLNGSTWKARKILIASVDDQANNGLRTRLGGRMPERNQTRRNSHDRFMQAVNEELTKFECSEREFRKKDRDERARCRSTPGATVGKTFKSSSQILMIPQGTSPLAATNRGFMSGVRDIANPIFRKPSFLIAALRTCPSDALIGMRRATTENVARDLFHFGCPFLQLIYGIQRDVSLSPELKFAV
jgi:hypothetical protein